MLTGRGKGVVRVRCDMSELTPLADIGFLFDMQRINSH
jgi:hypothetical protein